MYLSKVQSRVLAVSAIVLFIFGALASGWRAGETQRLPIDEQKSETLTQPNTPSSTASANSSLPASGHSSRFMLQNFQRSEVKDGKKVWEVIAPTGEYNPAEHSASVTNPSLSVYKKDGKRIQLTAEQAEVRFEENSLVWAKAVKKVHIDYADELSIDGVEAIYDRANEIVTSLKPVTIKTARLEISGNALKADLASQEILISKNVKTTILPLKRAGAR